MRTSLQLRESALLRNSAFRRYSLAFVLIGLSFSATAQTSAPPEQAPAINRGITPAVGSPSPHRIQEAEAAFLAGARSLDRNDLTGAEIQFDKAVKLNPSNSDYASAYAITHQRHVSQLVQESGKARLLGQNEKAETLLAEARLLDPQNSIVSQSVDSGSPPKLFHPEIEPWIREGPAVAGPVTLLPNPGTKSFHLRGSPQDVLRQVLSGFGIRAAFDESAQGKEVRFDLDDANYERATAILLNMTHFFAVPVEAKSVIIAKDTQENRARFERQLQETIYIPGMTNEQMDELGNVVRNVFDVKQLTVNKNSGTLVIRAPQETLTYVNLTLADLIDGGSEVMIDLKLYAVDKTNDRNIGAQLPQQIGVYNVRSAADAIVNANQSLVNQAIAQGLVPAGSSNITIALALIASGLVQSATLSHTIGFFGGGLTETGITVNQNPVFNLSLTASDTHALNDVQLRVGDRQQAVFRIGQRYPITTATYSSGLATVSSAVAGVTINGVSAASLLNAAAGTPITIPQIQYEDLGLTLKATPTVQRSGAVNLRIDLKIESLTGGAVNNIPILNSQQFLSDVTVDDGDTAMMVSSLSKSAATSLSGYPGLAYLPGFQTATADRVTTTDSSNLILLITPHVTRRRPNLTAGPRIAVNLPEPPG